MKLLKRFLLFAFAIAAWSQTPTPDCPPQQFYFTNGNGVQVFDNRSIGCDQWTLVYQADAGISGYTLAFKSTTGINAPGTFVAYAGNTVNSSASFGTAANGLATYCSLASCSSMGVTVNTPWVEVLVSGASGAGAVRGTFYGYRTGYTGGTGGSGGGGGGGGGCTSPCPVVGTAASGSAPSGDPVQTAGYDGTDIRTLRTDSSGRPVVVGGAASGAVPVGNPIPVAGFDGTDTRVVSTDSSGDVNVNVVSSAGAGAFTSSQQAITTSAVNLGSNMAKSVCVHALIGNIINVYAGASGVTDSTGMEIPPGQGYCWNVANTNLIYVIASTTGASVSVTWTN